MYGVRLSFALSYWEQLGEVYPPALTALKKTRDDKTALLLDGKAIVICLMMLQRLTVLLKMTIKQLISSANSIRFKEH